LPGVEIAQYGIAVFALAGVFYFGGQFFRWIEPRKPSQATPVKDIKMLEILNDSNEVIKNNTRALENLSGLIQMLQINMTRQEAKIDELLERARR
jgi:hypothetical protein